MHCNNNNDYLSDSHDSVYLNNISPDVLKVSLHKQSQLIFFCLFTLNSMSSL
jgi:hypothetical protein